MSPTSRTLLALRRSNYVAGVVEKWNPHAGVRQDLFGCIDVIAARRGEPGILGIQATTLGNLSTRLTKARSRPELAVWLSAGGRFECWGWFRQAGRWKAKRVEVRAGEVAPVILDGGRRRRRKDQRDLFDHIKRRDIFNDNRNL